MALNKTASDNDSFTAPRMVYDEAVAPMLPAAEAVLRQIFSDYEQVDIAQELGGGFTQSRVLVAQPVRAAGSSADLPLVLKIGPTWLIRQEQEGYTRFIRDKLAGRIELVTVELSDGWGVLGYRLAGDGQFKHESLAHYCRQTESDTLTAMLTGRLFRRLGTLWRNADLRPEPYPATKYDLLLPVRLVIEPQLLPSGISPTLLTPEQLTSDDLAAGDPVRLAGFVISEVDAGSREVTLDLPAEAGQKRSHRLRLQPVEAIERYRVGERLPAVEGRVTQTRRGRLRAEADQVLGSSAELELTNGQLRLAGGRVLPNPLAHLSALLSDWPAVKLAFQHGDLNLENVLVDPATRDVTLIDFANAGVEHVLHDLLHLEMSVVTSLLAEALLEVGETPGLIGPVFYDRLHRAATQDPALYTPPRLLQPALKKVYTILAAIRQTAQSYLSNPDDWGEYYRGLALYLVGALKFKDLDEVPAAPYPKQLALVGAAVAVEWWQQPQVQPAPVDDLAVELQSAFAGSSEYDLSHKQLVLADGTRLLNPLAVLPDLLEPWVGTCLGRVHGRLELAELITELERQPADLIEAEVGQDERLHHLLRLETAVVAGLLPRALTEANQPPETIRFLFYERLHRALSGDPAQFASPKALPPALAKPYQLLAAIRQQAARFLTTDTDWTTYYHGLALYLLGTLHPPEQLVMSNEQLTNPPPHPSNPPTLHPSNPPILHPSNHLTLLTAAITTDLWRRPANRPHPPAPYQGLHAFQEENSPFFFGRETFVEQLVETIQHQPLLAVTGASGSGKSSVVLAGLVPRLRQTGDWLIITVRPGSAPFEEMAKVLVPLIERRFSDELVHDWAETLRQGKKNLVELITQRSHPTQQPQRLLLIIDQFEELYTLCSEPETRQRFIDMLFQSSNPPTLQPSNPPPPSRTNLPTFYFILTLRADFMGKVLAYRPLADVLRGNIELLGAMNRAELDRAIECPAEKLGVSFEAGLVERILDDVGDEPGHLPLLEFALTQLWHLQSNGRLTWAAYESIGRVPGAVTHYAEQVYGGLTPVQQSQARRIFTQLVQPGAGTEDTRRVATAAELEADWPLVQQLAGSRLVVANRDATGSEIIEIVHEALIQNWQRLGRWMATDRTFRAWQERLRVAISQWETTDQDSGGLLRGGPLAEAVGWLADRENDLNLVEQRFIRASTSLREQEAKAAEARQQAELEKERQMGTRLRQRAMIAGSIGLVAILAAITAMWFGFQANQQTAIANDSMATAEAEAQRANHEATIAHSRQLTAEALNLIEIDTQQAVVSALKAITTTLSLGEPVESEAITVLHQAVQAMRLVQTLKGHAKKIFDVSYSSTGKHLASAGFDGQVIIWQATAPQHSKALPRESTELTSVLSARNDSQLILTDVTGQVEVWDLNQQQIVSPYPTKVHTEAILDAALSPDGLLLATTGADLTTRVTKLYTTEVLYSFPLEDFGCGISFGHNGTRLVAGDVTGNIYLWNLTSGELERQFFHSHQGQDACALAFSPNDQIIATGGADLQTKLWSVESGKLMATLLGHSDSIYRITFDSTGELLASASADGTANIYDVQSGSLLHTLIGHKGEIRTIAFSKDGKTLASGGADELVRIWNTAFLYHSAPIQTLSFSEDGSILFSASADGVVRLWDAGTSERINEININAPLWAITVHPDQTQLATISSDGFVEIWAINDELSTSRPLTKLKVSAFRAGGVAYSPDGKFLAAAADAGVTVWDVLSWQQVQFMATPAANYHVAFHPAGTQIAVASIDQSASIFDLRSGDLVLKFSHDPSVDISRVRFSPDGMQLATAGADGKVIFWDAASGELLSEVAGHTKSVIDVAFDSGGSHLVTGSADKTVRVWDIEKNDNGVTIIVPKFELKSSTKEIRSVVFSPDGKQLVTAGGDQVIRIYPTSLQDLVDEANRRLIAAGN